MASITLALNLQAYYCFSSSSLSTSKIQLLLIYKEYLLQQQLSQLFCPSHQDYQAQRVIIICSNSIAPPISKNDIEFVTILFGLSLIVSLLPFTKSKIKSLFHNFSSQAIE